MSEMLNVTIDGVSVQAAPGMTIVEAAKLAGVEIPTLCHDKRIEAYGASSCLLNQNQRRYGCKH